ncbi:MAG TPA: hypothetical protein VIP77_24480 [Jiangellaceae bacterium]
MTHNSHAHPHLDRGPGGLAVSYNVHSLRPAGREPGQPWAIYDHASLYRPRVVTLRWAEP